MFDRRSMLKRSGLIALAPSVPVFLTRCADAAAEGKSDGRKLVIIQLDGGNDGINTLVPFADDGYAKNRQRLRLPKDRLIKLGDQVGLHPSMGDFGKLWESQRLAVVQGVGYPNPNRSHDISMAIWQTCQFDRREQNTHGWLGRALDQASRPKDGSPAAFLIGDEQPPVALRGRRSVAAAVNRIEDFVLPDSTVTAKPNQPVPSENLESFLQRTSLDAYTTADRLAEIAKKSAGGSSYPRTTLAGRLQLISRLIKAG